MNDKYLYTKIHKFLLAGGPKPTAEIYTLLEADLEGMSKTQFASDVLRIMCDQDILEYRLLEGVWAAKFVKEGRKPSQTAGRAYHPPAGMYDGAELRDTCLRKGAYDFLSKPSIVGSERVEHRTAYLSVPSGAIFKEF